MFDRQGEKIIVSLSTKYRWLVNLLPLSCKTGVVTCTHHNHLCDVFVEFCHHAHLGVRVELGSCLTPDLSHTWPADVLVDWERRKHGAFDIIVTFPLIPSILTAASLSERVAAEDETRKHKINDPKCLELGWCIQHTQTIFICTFAHLKMYMYLQSTMHQLAKLEIEAATSP